MLLMWLMSPTLLPGGAGGIHSWSRARRRGMFNRRAKLMTEGVRSDDRTTRCEADDGVVDDPTAGQRPAPIRDA